VGDGIFKMVEGLRDPNAPGLVNDPCELNGSAQAHFGHQPDHC